MCIFVFLLWDLGLPLWSLGRRSANCTRCPDMSVTGSQVRAPGLHRSSLCCFKSNSQLPSRGLVGWGGEALPRRGDRVAVRVARGNPSTLHTGDGRPWMTFPLPPVRLWADCVPVLRWSSQLGPTLTCPSALRSLVNVVDSQEQERHYPSPRIKNHKTFPHTHKWRWLQRYVITVKNP